MRRDMLFLTQLLVIIIQFFLLKGRKLVVEISWIELFYYSFGEKVQVLYQIVMTAMYNNLSI